MPLRVFCKETVSAWQHRCHRFRFPTCPTSTFPFCHSTSIQESPPFARPLSERNIHHHRYFHTTCYLQKKSENDAAGEINAVTGSNLEKEQIVDVSNATDLDQHSKKTSTTAEGFTDVPGTTTGQGKKMMMLFTCKVCETRSAKQFTERAYRHGVVLVRCPGCENLHLIADRLGWFEDQGDDGQGWDVEKALKNAGENVLAVTDDNVLEMTLEDVLGKKP